MWYISRSCGDWHGKTEQACVNVNTRAQTLKMVDDESRDKVLSERDSAFPDSVDLVATEEKEVRYVMQLNLNQ